MNPIFYALLLPGFQHREGALVTECSSQKITAQLLGLPERPVPIGERLRLALRIDNGAGSAVQLAREGGACSCWQEPAAVLSQPIAAGATVEIPLQLAPDEGLLRTQESYRVSFADGRPACTLTVDVEVEGYNPYHLAGNVRSGGGVAPRLLLTVERSDGGSLDGLSLPPSLTRGLAVAELPGDHVKAWELSLREPAGGGADWPEAAPPFPAFYVYSAQGIAVAAYEPEEPPECRTLTVSGRPGLATLEIDLPVLAGAELVAASWVSAKPLHFFGARRSGAGLRALFLESDPIRRDPVVTGLLCSFWKIDGRPRLQARCEPLRLLFPSP